MEVIDAALWRIPREVVQQVPDVMKERRGDQCRWCAIRRRKLRTLQRMLFLRHSLAPILRAAVHGEKVDNGGCGWMVAHRRILAVLNYRRLNHKSQY
jgi:hypothetical protein